jgi:16S rRNA (cytidine1402-2'-O)-methyltransferase
LGFLPKKSGERKRILESYKEIEGAKVVYESPFRVERLIGEIREIWGKKVEIRICREMTKKFEEVTRESRPKKVKGEITVVFV